MLIVSLTKRPLALLAALALALALAFGTFASAAYAMHLQNEPDEKRVLCHAVGGPQGFEVIAVDESAVDDVAGHQGHEEDFILEETLGELRDEFGDDITDEEVEAVCRASVPTTTTTTTGTGTTTTTGPPPTTTTTGTPPPTVVTQPPDVIVKKKPHVVVKKKGVVVAKGTATPTATVTAKATATPTAKTVTATATPTATVTAKATAASAQYVQYKQYATATALPETGGTGPVLPIAVGALLLVLGSGIMVLRMARSSS
jgi:LPXTG-motif cell wall-anchored protein